MKVSIEGKKVVVYDIPPQLPGENAMFDRNVIDVKWYRYSSIYLYEECLKRGIQIITADIYFGLENKPKHAICVRDRADIDMSIPERLRADGVKLALFSNSEQPLYACRLFWNLKRVTDYFDNTEIQTGVKSRLSPRTKFRHLLTPHTYYTHIREVPSNFHEKKFMNLMNSNQRIHWARQLYVAVMHTLKPLPTFTNRDQYLERLKAIKYFSQFDDFDLYGNRWDQPVRYTHVYDEAIKKSYRGSPYDKYETIKQYKFSLVFDSFLGGYLQEKMADCLYAGSVPVYWGAPDIADIIPKGCFIDFRDFGCDYARLNDYLRNMDEQTYNGYIKSINEWIAAPQSSPMGGYALSQEKYTADLIKLFESYF